MGYLFLCKDNPLYIQVKIPSTVFVLLLKDLLVLFPGSFTVLTEHPVKEVVIRLFMTVATQPVSPLYQGNDRPCSE